MKKIIQILFLSLLSIALYSQQDCYNGFEDPLTNFDYNEDLDLCCGMVFPEEGTVCYDVSAYPNVSETYYVAFADLKTRKQK